MRALVFSDSHGRVQPMVEAVSRYVPDAVFHLGDVIRDGEALRESCSHIPFYQVAGNCDLFSGGYPAESVVRLEGKTVFFLHGHTANVKLGESQAVAMAQALEADLLLFGHTHRPLVRRYDKLLAVNPGAAMDGRAALLTWQGGGEIDCQPVGL